MSHLLFVSHAGADVEAAVKFAERLESTEAAKEAGLKVWVDTRELLPGQRWKDRLQDALHRSTAFVVLVGARGVVNWVWDEVSVAMDRAHDDTAYPLIPILGPGVAARDLPGFLSQYQCVVDEGKPEVLAQLLRSVLRLDPGTPIETVRDPFVGLRSYDSRKAHLFFGRAGQVDALLALFRDDHLVMVVGESGAGKSSLVRAGLVPAFLGGRLGDGNQDRPDETRWLTIETRPETDPFGRLADDLRDAARRFGVSPGHASELAEMVRQSARAQGSARNVQRIRDALLASVPAEAGDTCKLLLVVDQFEEVATAGDAKEYADVLLGLAAANNQRIRVVLTMRSDYYYLCKSFDALYQRLEGHERRARFLIPRMSQEELRECIEKPLVIAGISSSTAADLATAVLRDIGGQASDLALVQMALWRTWNLRRKHEDDLLRTYVAIGRVEGALAQSAEEVFERLSAEDQARAETLFVRLVNPGESGGVVRRVARLDEFADGIRALARSLAEEEQARLVTVAEYTVEITHEQLATQWLRYQQWISNAPGDARGDDLRVLRSIMQDGARWVQASEVEKSKHLAQGYDLELYVDLARRRDHWLSAAERLYLKRSVRAEKDDQDRVRRNARKLRILTVASLSTALAAVALLAMGAYLWKLRNEARGAMLGTVAQAMLAQPLTQESAPQVGTLAAMGWQLGRNSDSWNALQRVPILHKVASISLDDFGTPDAAIGTSDGRQVVARNSDGTVSVWVLEKRPRETLRLKGGAPFTYLTLGAEGKILVTAGEDRAVRFWNVADGKEAQKFQCNGNIRALKFSQNGKILAVSCEGEPLRIFDASTGTLRGTLTPGERDSISFAIANDGDLVAFAGVDGDAWIRSVRLPNPELHLQLREHARTPVLAVAFSPDVSQLTILQADGTAVRFALEGTRQIAIRPGEPDAIGDYLLSPDGKIVIRVPTRGSQYGAHEAQIESMIDSRIVHFTFDNLAGIGFTPDGKALAIGYEETSGGSSIGFEDIWAFELGGREDARIDFPKELSALDMDADGDLVAVGSMYGIAEVYSISKGNLVAALSTRGNVDRVVLMPGGSRLVTSFEQELQIWSIDSDPRELGHVAHEAYVLAITADVNGSVASVSTDGVLKTVRSPYTEAPKVARLAEKCNLATFSPNGQWLLCLDERGTGWVKRTFDVGSATEFEISDYDPEFTPVMSIAVSDDGALIAVSEEKRLPRVLRATDGKELARFSGQDIVDVRFGVNNTLLALSARDGVVRLIGIPSLREVARVDAAAPLFSTALSESGMLALTDGNSNVRFWSTNFDHMLQRFCAAGGANLSKEEWANYGYQDDLPWEPVCETESASH